MTLSHLCERNPQFPDPMTALEEPDGLLAVGGNLAANTLIEAYSRGIFPWYQDGDPLLWWSPSQRCVLHPSQLHVSRSLKKIIRRGDFSITSDTVFDQVLSGCIKTRIKQSGGTWITPAMRKAYNTLHNLGIAHSVEVWQDNQLQGGLYGVAIGGVFCGESMFSYSANSSKLAFVALCDRLKDADFGLIDCQMETAHLNSLGAISIARESFLERLKLHVDRTIIWPLF